MSAFVMQDDEDFDLSSEEGRQRARDAVLSAARRYDVNLTRPLGGAKGGVGRGMILHKNIIHRIK